MFARDEVIKISDEQKITAAKYAVVFTGGFLLGYGIKKALDSGIVENLVSSASGFVSDDVSEDLSEDDDVFEEIEIE